MMRRDGMDASVLNAEAGGRLGDGWTSENGHGNGRLEYVELRDRGKEGAGYLFGLTGVGRMSVLTVRSEQSGKRDVKCMHMSQY